MHPNAWFPLLPVDGRLPGDIPKLFPPPGIHEEGRIPPTPGIIVPLSVVHCQERRLPLTAEEVFWQNVKRRTPQCPSSHQNTIGGFRGPSQAICKIHIDTNSLQALSSRHNLKATTFPYDSRIPTRHTWWNLPIYWHASSSSERNPEFLPFILRIFDFHEWKQYCLGSEAILFDSENGN